MALTEPEKKQKKLLLNLLTNQYFNAEYYKSGHYCPDFFIIIRPSFFYEKDLTN